MSSILQDLESIEVGRFQKSPGNEVNILQEYRLRIQVKLVHGCPCLRFAGTSFIFFNCYFVWDEEPCTYMWISPEIYHLLTYVLTYLLTYLLTFESNFEII